MMMTHYRRRHLASDDVRMVYRLAAARIRCCQRELAVRYIAVDGDEPPAAARRGELMDAIATVDAILHEIEVLRL